MVRDKGMNEMNEKKKNQSIQPPPDGHLMLWARLRSNIVTVVNRIGNQEDVDD